MTDQTPQGGLCGPQSAPDDSRDAEGAHDASERRTADRGGLREQIATALWDAVGPAAAEDAIVNTVMAVRDRELEQLRTDLREMRTTARVNYGLHKAAHEEAEQWRKRAEQAEAAIARVEAIAGRLELAQYGVDLEADGIRRAIARDIRAALDGQQQDDRTAH